MCDSNRPWNEFGMPYLLFGTNEQPIELVKTFDSCSLVVVDKNYRYLLNAPNKGLTDRSKIQEAHGSQR